MRALATGKPVFDIPLAGVEALKWVGLLAMLQEHVFRYALGHYPFASYVVGRMAFPLFAFALVKAASLYDEKFPQLLARLLLWGAISAAARVFVLEPLPLNIMFTFALGLVAARCISQGVGGVFIALCAIAAGSVCEYGAAGVLFVAITRVYFERGALWCLLLAVAALCLANHGWIPALAFVLAPIVAHLGTGIPRVRGVFYWIYAGQWPVIAGLRYAL